METLNFKSMWEREDHTEDILFHFPDIPEKATIRLEYTLCGNSDCKKCHSDSRDSYQDDDGEKRHLGHGPYIRAYWREGKKINKKHIGKRLEDYRIRKTAKVIELTPSRYLKSNFIEEHANRGDPIAQKYYQKLKREKVSIDRAYKVLVNSHREARLFKMIEIADHEHIHYNDEIQLLNGIASMMVTCGFDPSYEEEWDRYLNSDLGNIHKGADTNRRFELAQAYE